MPKLQVVQKAEIEDQFPLFTLKWTYFCPPKKQKLVGKRFGRTKGVLEILVVSYQHQVNSQFSILNSQFI